MVAITNIVSSVALLAAGVSARAGCTSTTSAHSKPTHAPAVIPPLSIMALRSASPIHFGQVNANGGNFYIGKDASTYCPLTNKKDCPPGKQTVLLFGNGGASMDDAVPGGQSVYIAKDGSLSYTQAHSAFIPAGSITTGFSVGAKQSNTLRELSAAGTWYACPAKANTGPWKIYISKNLKSSAVPSKNVNDCLGFDAVGVEYVDAKKGAAAWQYS